MNLKLIISIMILIILCTSVALQVFGSQRAKSDSLEDIFTYLSRAEKIVIEKNDYIPQSQKVVSKVLCDLGQSEVMNFVSELRGAIVPAVTDVEVDRYYAFSGNYRVYLACNNDAVIDFIFSDDNNVACLRSDEFYFFTRFSPESAGEMKYYFSLLDSQPNASK